MWHPRPGGCLVISAEADSGGEDLTRPPQRGGGRSFPSLYGPLTRCASVAVSRVERGAIFPRKRGKEGRRVLSRSGVVVLFRGCLRPSVVVSLVPFRPPGILNTGAPDGRSIPAVCWVFPQGHSGRRPLPVWVWSVAARSPTWALFAQAGLRCLNCEGADLRRGFYSPLAACRFTRVPAFACAGCFRCGLRCGGVSGPLRIYGSRFPRRCGAKHPSHSDPANEAPTGRGFPRTDGGCAVAG